MVLHKAQKWLFDYSHCWQSLPHSVLEPSLYNWANSYLEVQIDFRGLFFYCGLDIQYVQHMGTSEHSASRSLVRSGIDVKHIVLVHSQCSSQRCSIGLRSESLFCMRVGGIVKQVQSSLYAISSPSSCTLTQKEMLIVDSEKEENHCFKLS